MKVIGNALTNFQVYANDNILAVKTMLVFL